MIEQDRIKQMVMEGDEHTLTIYVTVDPSVEGNVGATPGWHRWLKNTLNTLEDDAKLEKDDIWKSMRAAAETYFNDLVPNSKSIALFLTPQAQEAYELEVRVENAATYGKPAVMPLLWAIDEYEPYLIVLVDHAKSRFFTASLGGVGFDDARALEIPIEEWRDKTGTSLGSGGMPGIGRGNQHDEFDQRVDEHQQRFFRDIAASIEAMVRNRGIERIIIGGNETSAHAVRDYLHESVTPFVMGVLAVPMSESTKDILERAQPQALEYERQHEMALVEDIINLAKSGNRGSLGLDNVMNALEMQQVELLVLPYPANQYLEMNLPERVFACNGSIELVQGAAAERLIAEGGLGARLYFAIGNKMPEQPYTDKAT